MDKLQLPEGVEFTYTDKAAHVTTNDALMQYLRHKGNGSMPLTRMILTVAAGIKPPQTEEGKKRSEQFKRLKGLCEASKKVKIFGALPERMEEKLRQKYGSRDYNALDEEMRKTFVKVISLDLSDRYARIKQPTLLIWGDRDTETPLWMGQRMEKDIPDAGLVVLEGGTHFAYLEQAQRFCAIARHFLLED